MARVDAEYARAREAFAAPSLSLLSRTWAPVIVAVFATVFDRDRGTIAEDDLRSALPAQLAALRAGGVAVPDDPPVALLRQWVSQGFLERRSNPDSGGYDYVLTSHTQDVLEFVGRNSGTRGMLGQSKLRTLADILRRAALAASTDRDAVVARYDADIARLVAERDRVANGDARVEIDEYALIEEAVQAISTIRSLPADFARVQESFRRMTRDLQEAFLADARPHGDVVAEYLRACDALAETSAEGRAFSGAIDLLRDEALLNGVEDDIRTVLDALDDAFDPDEHATLTQAVPSIRAGLTHVLRQRAAATTALKTGIETYDAIAERQLADALRDAHRALSAIAARSLNAKVPGPPTPQPAAIVTLSRAVRDDHVGAPPAPLSAHASTETTSTQADLRTFGGPRLHDLARWLTHPDARTRGDVATGFGSLPSDLRRPVEILGLLQLASSPGWDVDVQIVDGSVAVYRAVRPDGVPVAYEAPRIDLPTADDTDRPRPDEIADGSGDPGGADMTREPGDHDHA